MRSRDGRWKRLNGDWCLYCGALADSGDHFPCRAVAYSGWILPACRQCNSTLNDRWPWNLEKRIEMAKAEIVQRTRHLMRSPPWDADDLSELGPNMRREVKLWQEKRKIARARIAWNATVYLCLIDKDNDFARFRAEIDGTLRTARG